jgi:hypothetical protein
MLMSVLETIKDERNNFRVDCNEEPALCSLARNCHEILEDFQELKQHFDAVGTQAQRSWDRGQ